MNIIDCFTEIMAFTLHFMTKVEQTQPKYDEIFEKYNQLIVNSRSLINNDKLLYNDWERSLFAVCAWIDEKVLFSNWQDKEIWQLNPLQKQYFRTTQAGEKFYEVLERFDPVADRQVIEVFNYCIKLGFQGKNFNGGQKVQLASQQNLLVNYAESDINESGVIFPSAYRSTGSVSPKKSHRFGFKAVLLVTSLIALLGLGMLDAVYNVSLNEQLAGYFK